MAARRPQRHGRRDREGGRRGGCGCGRRLWRPDGSELIRIERAGPSTKGESGSLI